MIGPAQPPFFIAKKPATSDDTQSAAITLEVLLFL
jgi:hypothetical protein